MNISFQFDGTVWASVNNVQIEVFDGGANKYVDEVLAVRYECSEVTPSVLHLVSNINELDNVCFNLCNMFGGEIIDE
jgi:hypothetical protein